jgi:predicted MPP superfamily phosphohydrolase
VIIFLTIALTIYTLVNFYIIRRGWQAWTGIGFPGWIFLAACLVLVLAYPLGRFLERGLRLSAGGLLLQVGSFYFAVMLYGFLFVLLVDILRLADRLFSIFPGFVRRQPARTAAWALGGVAAAVFLIALFGYLNALRPRIRTLDVAIAKPAGALKGLRIAVASDIHLGTIIRNSRLVRIAALINGLRPDIVLLPGDVVDESVPAEEEERMTTTLRAIQAPLGVYAVSGNHEYYGGIAKNVGYLTRAGVRVLQDEAVRIGDAFALAGRIDPTGARFGQERKSLAEILEGLDRRLPVILLDHQPFHLEEAEANGVDLQLSGHTHAGQLFPLNLINKALYEQNWGYWRRGATQYYVSCGVGTWGPPIRTGSRPEIVLIRVSFGNQGAHEP